MLSGESGHFHEQAALQPTFFELFDYPGSGQHQAKFANMKAEVMSILPEGDHWAFSTCADLFAWGLWPTQQPPLALEIGPSLPVLGHSVTMNRKIEDSAGACHGLLHSKGFTDLHNEVIAARLLVQTETDKYIQRVLRSELPFQYILSLSNRATLLTERSLDDLEKTSRRARIYTEIPGADHELPPDIALLRKDKVAAVEFETTSSPRHTRAATPDAKLRQIIAAHSDDMPDLITQAQAIAVKDGKEPDFGSLVDDIQDTAGAIAQTLLPPDSLIAPVYPYGFSDFLTYMFTQTEIPYKQRGQKALEYTRKFIAEEVQLSHITDYFYYRYLNWLGSVTPPTNGANRFREKRSLGGYIDSSPSTADKVTNTFAEYEGSALATVNRYHYSESRILQFVPRTQNAPDERPTDDPDLHISLLYANYRLSPYVAGYDLVGNVHDDYYFTKSANDPYACEPLMLTRRQQATAAKVFRRIGLSALADELMDHADLTFGELVAAQRKHSFYQEYYGSPPYIPPNLEACVRANRFFTQCTGAFVLLSTVAAEVFPSAKITAVRGNRDVWWLLRGMFNSK